jgi:phage-related protein
MSDGRPLPKPLKWMGSSKDDLLRFPDQLRKEFGHALYLAQIGMKAPKAKPLRGFGGAGVLEVVGDYRGETYRAVYTVKFRTVVCVLHAFQKKSKHGIATPRADLELIKTRLKAAADAFELLQKKVNP